MKICVIMNVRRCIRMCTCTHTKYILVYTYIKKKAYAEAGSFDGQLSFIEYSHTQMLKIKRNHTHSWKRPKFWNTRRAQIFEITKKIKIKNKKITIKDRIQIHLDIYSYQNIHFSLIGQPATFSLSLSLYIYIYIYIFHGSEYW